MIVCDLDRVAEDMGSHFRAHEANTYCAYCDCGEKLTQEMAVCPGCLEPVVWLNSKKWKRLHGSPTMRMRELTAIEPETPSGRYLVSRARVPGFKNESEAQEWRIANKALGTSVMREIVDYCHQDKGGRGLVKHAINLALKRAGDVSEEMEVIG